MFNWLGNLFPYSDLHSLNLDWILSKMKETAAQAAKAIADSASALAQVIEAKTAAQDAQTAAQNAQTAANNAQTAANNAADSAENAISVAQAAKSAAQTAQNTAQTAQNTAETAQSAAQAAQNTANTAQSAAQTAQNTAQTAQNTAETAQSAAQAAQNTANTAQSAAQTANTGVKELNSRFPITTPDIASEAVTGAKIANRSVSPGKLQSNRSIIYLETTGLSHIRIPVSGSATIAQITEGIVFTNNYFLNNVSTEFIQMRIAILESGSESTVFKCESYPVALLAKSGTVSILPFIIFNDNTNETYDGFVKISMKTISGETEITCKVIFKTNPPFADNTGFVIEVGPLYSKLSRGIFMFHVKHHSQSSSQVTNSRPALLVALVMMIAKSSPSMRETMSAKSRWKVGEMEWYFLSPLMMARTVCSVPLVFTSVYSAHASTGMRSPFSRSLMFRPFARVSLYMVFLLSVRLEMFVSMMFIFISFPGYHLQYGAPILRRQAI